MVRTRTETLDNTKTKRYHIRYIETPHGPSLCEKVWARFLQADRAHHRPETFRGRATSRPRRGEVVAGGAEGRWIRVCHRPRQPYAEGFGLGGTFRLSFCVRPCLSWGKSVEGGSFLGVALWRRGAKHHLVSRDFSRRVFPGYRRFPGSGVVFMSVGQSVGLSVRLSSACLFFLSSTLIEENDSHLPRRIRGSPVWSRPCPHNGMFFSVSVCPVLRRTASAAHSSGSVT